MQGEIDQELNERQPQLQGITIILSTSETVSLLELLQPLRRNGIGPKELFSVTIYLLTPKLLIGNPIF